MTTKNGVYLSKFNQLYMKNPRAIEQIDNWTYSVPRYEITDDGVVDADPGVISLCRGNKADSTAPRQNGMFTETLLQVCLQYLEGVNVGELRNRDTSLAITAIEDALLRIGKRAEDRKIRNVQATYNK